MDADDGRLLERYYRDKSKAEAKDKFLEVSQLCNCIGELLSKYGRYEDAIKEHTQEKQLCEILQDRIGEAVACRKIGECHCALGRYSEALKLQKRHLNLARQCENSLEEQRAWGTIGRTYLCKAEGRNLKQSSLDNTRAENAFFKALEICKKVKTSVQPAEYTAMYCRVLLNIGLVYDNRADVQKSSEIINRAISAAEAHRLDTELLMCHSTLITVWQNDRKYSLSLKACQQALKLAQKLRDKLQECDLLISMATVRVAIGDYVEAKHCLKKAHKLRVERDDDKIVTMFRAVNKMQEANEELEDKENLDKSEQYEIFADCLAELGLYKDAIDYYMKVLTSSSLSKQKKASIYVSLAETFSDIRQYGYAIFYFKKELEVCSNDPEQACRTKLSIAELEELSGSLYSTVRNTYLDALDLAKKAKHVRLMVLSLKSLIVVQRLCEQWKHLEETEKMFEAVRKKYKLGRGAGDAQGDEEEDDEEDSEQQGTSLQEPETTDGNLSLSDLTVSDDSSDEEKVVGFKRKRNNIARRNEKGETPLHRACIDGNLSKVKSLIEKGHPINLRDHCGWIPLHEACNHGHEAIVEVLLDKGAWINDRGGEMCGGVTPLIDAANCGNLEVMSVLMRHGASLVAKDDNSHTALECLHAWYGSNSDHISATELFKYCEVEKLLSHATGKNPTGSTNKTTSPGRHEKKGSKALVTSAAYAGPSSSSTSISSSIMHSSQTGRSNVKDRFKRLPDLEDVLGEDYITTASTSSKASFKERLVQLKEKRKSSKFSKLKRPTRDERNRNKASNVKDGDLASIEESDEDREIAINPRKSDPNPRDNAFQAYRQVMNSMRSSAQSRVKTDEEKENCDESDDDDLPCGQKKNVPYMDSDVDVGDDWLIDDVGALAKSKGKKRSYEVNKMLSGNQTKRPSTSSFRLKQARYCKSNDTHSGEISDDCVPSTSRHVLDKMFGLDSDSRDSIVSIHSDSRDNIVSIPSPKSSQIDFIEISNSTDEVNDEARVDNQGAEDFWDSDGDDDLLAASLMYENYSTSDSHSIPSPKSSQIDFIEISNSTDKVNDEARVDNQGAEDFWDSDGDDDLLAASLMYENYSTCDSHSLLAINNSIATLHQNSLVSSTSLSADKSKQNSVSNNPSTAQVKKFKCSVNVNIEDKVLRVPIYVSDENKTMAWLAQQAAERYFSSFFVLPVLTLKTLDGVILGPSDPIGPIVDSIQELNADVRAWNKQSAAERYEKVCEAFYEECQGSIKSVLQNLVRSNNRLDLNDFNLGLQPLLPVFQALDGERSLIELRLGGNRLSDSGIVSLTKLLSSLTNLRVLALDSNELRLEGLEPIASFAQAGSGLQSLTELSLSYNCLTNKAEAPIKLLLRSLHSLSCLRLGACYLTSGFFTPELLHSLKESSITTLTLSENQFSREVIQSLLEAVCSHLMDLDLSHSLSNHNLNPCVDRILHPIINAGGNVLQSLSLAGCHLTENDVLVVNRLPVLIPSLSQLNISHNRNVGNSCLQKLFSFCISDESNLHTITARGCSIRSPLEDELLDLLKLKLQSKVPFKKLVFSCRGLPSAESDLLSHFWKDKWKGMGKVNTSGMIVDLSLFSSSS